MFNPTFDTVQASQIILNRLARLQNVLRSFVAYTQVDYQAKVYSSVNQVLNLGNNMTPPFIFAKETPALIGDLTTNLNNLNNDGQDIAAEVISIEKTLAQYYNLTAGVQNTLRQSIREQIYRSIASEYIEAYVTDQQIQAGYTTNFDFNAGVATTPLTSDTVITPLAITLGPSSIGSNPSYDPMQLLNPTNQVTNLVTWNGSQLELQLSFATPTPINRLIIRQDNYEGLEIASLSSSPDGIFFDPISAELFPVDLTLDAQSGKFSGDAIIDFNPRNVSVLKIIINDMIGQGFISLRGIETHQLLYAAAGQYTTNSINTPTGIVIFNTSQRTYNQLTSIVHQLSYDGANFQVIQPGQVINLTGSPFWYRAQLNRIAAGFSGLASPLTAGNDVLGVSTNYVLGNITSTNLNGGILQRNIIFTTITGSILLNETPIPGTLSVYFGSVLQLPTAYTFVNDTLLLTTLPQSNVTVRYQSSTLGTAGLITLENYFTPYLFQTTFEVV